jgi:hypothetical protein
MITSIAKGLWTAIRTPKLVLLLWVWNLLLGLAAAWPARTWFASALDYSTETDRLLTRFNIGALNDISKASQTSPGALAMSALIGVGLVALVANAFMNGGIVEVIATRSDDRSFMHRFFRGGGHFFWRFTRLGLLAFVIGAVVVGVTSAGVGAVTSALGESEWEPAGMVWGLAGAAVSGLVALLFVLALDYARLQTARDGSRGMVRAYFRGLRFVASHVPATYVIALLSVVATVAVLLAYVGHEATWTTSTWPAIYVLIGVQQVLMLVRTGVRVAQVGAEWEYFAACTPVPAPAHDVPETVVAAADPVVAHEVANEPLTEPAEVGSAVAKNEDTPITS